MKNKFWVILTLGMLSAIGALSIDMYLPSFPKIARDFQTSVGQVSLSLSSFFIGISVGQLIYGPLLDRFGRKYPLYVGMGLYCIASIFCALVQSVDILILLRFFQALGCCAGMVAARAFVRDLFPIHENAKIFSALMLVLAISPIVAPTAGSYIAGALSWRAIFVCLAIISLLVMLAIFFVLPAGMEPDTSKSLKPRPIIKSFLSVAKVPEFFTYAFAGALTSSSLYAFIAGSPFLFMEFYDVSEKQYGWIFGFIALGLVLTSQLNRLFLKHFSSAQICVTALGFQVVTGFFMLCGTYFGWFDLYAIIVVIWLFLATQGFTIPNTSALALKPFSKNAGTASALMGAVRLGIGALVTASIGLLGNHTLMPMIAIMLLCSFLGFTVLFTGRRFAVKKVSVAKKIIN